MLQEAEGWEAAPYQNAAIGYQGAIHSGKTICGTLFGGAAFLGLRAGNQPAMASGVQNEQRLAAIESVNTLFRGFLERFGDTDCKTLTGCDFSRQEEADRYMREEIYKDTCFRQFEYVLSECLPKKSE